MRRPGLAWAGVASLLGLCALAGGWLPREAIDWQPQLVLHEPWRAVSAVGVHCGRAHLLLNLGGLALTGLLGQAAASPPRIAAAWAAAWPLTHLGLLLEPRLAHYGGLSGVLHAGVAAAATGLLLDGSRPQRVVAAVILAGLALKVLGEAPWGAALHPDPALGIAVAPFAHATGAVAGAVCACLATRWPLRPHAPTP